MAGPKGSRYYDVFLRQHIELVKGEESKVLDEEGFRLLVSIKNTDSIVAAARELGISYRKAWGLLRQIEQVLGFSLVSKHRGGKDGGKTFLSPEGIELTEAYSELRSKLDSALHDHVKSFFN
ncbi:MAG: LysR family transcriptional regulator, partial [Bacteroidales bacterium]|nr:LysR family transcriptional regulator [Bacteroidales bacterium]